MELLHQHMNTNDLKNWIILNQTPGIGPKTFLKILDSGLKLKSIIQSPRQTQPHFKLPSKAIEYLENHDDCYCDQAIDWLSRSPNHHIVTYDSHIYPECLRNIPQPPIILYGIGNIHLLNTRQISIVGTRNFSPYGKSNAQYFSKALSDRGFTITSGLASGIDAIAHQACLDSHGQTIAVMGTGINVIYPHQNIKLAKIIKEKGLLLSEFPLNTSPDRMHFPMRNRIISGLSLGTLVVESATKSGSLITAKHALEQGREVFAIPGNIQQASSSGCHALIKQGAKLVENIEDITEELPPITYHKSTTHPTMLTTSILTPDIRHSPIKNNESSSPLLQHIHYQTTSIDSIIEKSDHQIADITIELLELELAGHIESVPGGYKRL